jgi:hypothetical protein
MHSLFVVVDLHVTVNNIKILNIAQQRFFGKFVSGNNANYTYQILKKCEWQVICIFLTHYK